VVRLSHAQARRAPREHRVLLACLGIPQVIKNLTADSDQDPENVAG
jgi:hypothetical protein